MTNFKPKFVRDHFKDVLHDYERSFIGSFAQSVLEKIDVKPSMVLAG